MEFYENGILYLGQWYPIGRQTRVNWVGGQSFVLPTTWLGVSGCGERINVSFMKDAEKLFNRAYTTRFMREKNDTVCWESKLP